MLDLVGEFVAKADASFAGLLVWGALISAFGAFSAPLIRACFGGRVTVFFGVLSCTLWPARILRFPGPGDTATQ